MKAERAILDRLDELLRSKEVREQIMPIIERVRADLAQKPAAIMAWEPIPLTTCGAGLPPGIRSSWVFILRAGVSTGAERHPNSHQRMMSFDGSGDLQVRAGLDSPWQSNVLTSDPGATLEQRWVSIPQNIWHQPVVAKEADWVVVSFHTVPAEELIEERPDPGSASGTKQMVYLGEEN
jgi:ureidoglycolate hydrolase